jgi:hypothetical protein
MIDWERTHNRAAAIMKHFDKLPRHVRDKINNEEPLDPKDRTMDFLLYQMAHHQ